MASIYASHEYDGSDYDELFVPVTRSNLYPQDMVTPNTQPNNTMSGVGLNQAMVGMHGVY